MSDYFRNLNVVKLLFTNVLLTTGLVSAEENLGKTSYLQVCSACHGVDGNGLQIQGAEGFPPLSGSLWLKGDADRVAQIILHGLQGRIYVKGKKYDQVMPQQGSLTDETAVAVINYVRTEFGGEKGGYNIDDFKKARASSKNRSTQWTEKELLSRYPLQRPESPIKHLLMRSYTGDWAKIPDFKAMQEDAIEEEHDGYISLKKINKKENFGLMWVGEIEITKEGDHVFEINADDGAKLYINGEVVAQAKADNSEKKLKNGKVKLKPGLHKFRLDYFQKKGNKGISIKYREPGLNWFWLSESTKKPEAEVKVVIDLTPKDGQVRMYNNFIKGSSARTMGVGYPLGNNIAFSTEHCNLDLIWKGDFISAGRHWTKRGQGFEDPASEVVVSPSQGVAWSDATGSKLLNAQLNGIQTDEIGSPTFGYTIADNIQVRDSFISSSDSLERTISINTDKMQTVTFKVADSGEQQENNIVIGKLKIALPETAKITKNGKSHFVTLDLEKGTNKLNLTYSWTK